MNRAVAWSHIYKRLPDGRNRRGRVGYRRIPYLREYWRGNRGVNRKRMDGAGPRVNNRVRRRGSQHNRIAHHRSVSGRKRSQGGPGDGVDRIDGAVSRLARGSTRITVIGNEHRITRERKGRRSVDIAKILSCQNGPGA